MKGEYCLGTESQNSTASEQWAIQAEVPGDSGQLKLWKFAEKLIFGSNRPAARHFS
jgi:hypothetical protein